MTTRTFDRSVAVAAVGFPFTANSVVTSWLGDSSFVIADGVWIATSMAMVTPAVVTPTAGAEPGAAAGAGAGVGAIGWRLEAMGDAGCSALRATEALSATTAEPAAMAAIGTATGDIGGVGGEGE